MGLSQMQKHSVGTEHYTVRNDNWRTSRQTPPNASTLAAANPTTVTTTGDSLRDGNDSYTSDSYGIGNSGVAVPSRGVAVHGRIKRLDIGNNCVASGLSC